MNAGAMNKWVTLARSPQTTNDADGFFEPLSPARVPAYIQPTTASGDERSTFHQVTIRYHPQVTTDVRLSLYEPALLRTRELFVRGVQDVDERHAEMRLLCEEVRP
jgi:head-tail adaptor